MKEETRRKLAILLFFVATLILIPGYNLVVGGDCSNNYSGVHKAGSYSIIKGKSLSPAFNAHKATWFDDNKYHKLETIGGGGPIFYGGGNLLKVAPRTGTLKVIYTFTATCSRFTADSLKVIAQAKTTTGIARLAIYDWDAGGYVTVNYFSTTLKTKSRIFGGDVTRFINPERKMKLQWSLSIQGTAQLWIDLQRIKINGQILEILDITSDTIVPDMDYSEIPGQGNGEPDLLIGNVYSSKSVTAWARQSSLSKTIVTAFMS